jgi:hypothetical protein
MTGRTARPTWKLGRRTPPLRETTPGRLAPAAGLVAFAAVIALGGLWAGALGSDEPDARARADDTAKTPDVSPAVDRLVTALRRRKVEPTQAAEHLAVLLVDLKTGAITPVADGFDEGLTHCGSPCWGPAGGRILCDATPGGEFNQTRIQSFDSSDKRPEFTDLGPGNCPTFSPDGKRIAFLLNGGAVEDAEAGVWVMKSDGSDRRRLGPYGRPKWSPTRNTILTVSFANPCVLTFIDAETGEDRPVETPDLSVYSVPSWADATTLAAVVGTEAGESVVLLDVTDPDHGKVKEVLWKRGAESDPKPHYPVYSARTGRCVFVGVTPEGMAL